MDWETTIKTLRMAVDCIGVGTSSAPRPYSQPEAPCFSSRCVSGAMSIVNVGTLSAARTEAGASGRIPEVITSPAARAADKNFLAFDFFIFFLLFSSHLK